MQEYFTIEHILDIEEHSERTIRLRQHAHGTILRCLRKRMVNTPIRFERLVIQGRDHGKEDDSKRSTIGVIVWLAFPATRSSRDPDGLPNFLSDFARHPYAL